ncbi:hypothetical protein ACHWQZ_G006943 [Mnemiopsis leidyi]
MNQILCGLLLTLFFYVANGEGSAELRRFNMLKFGNTDQDYIMYQPNMSPLASEFTVCAWIRRLNSATRPVWFSYSSSVTSKEIQITDDGYQFYMFGTESDLRSVYTISPGTWFYNCLSWSSATQTRTVYINGRVVDSASTPAGRTLGQGGYLLFGNEQDGLGTGMDGGEIFGGEMYKLNVFSRMLTTSEIQELAQNMCVDIEQKYESTRYIKWEDILQLSRNGDVTEKDNSCLLEAYKLLNSELTERLNHTRLELNTTVEELARTRESLHSTEERLNETVIALDRSETGLNKTLIALNRSETRLNETLEELERTKVTHRETEARLNETLEIADNLEEKLNSTLESKCLLNSSITSHWDFLYASPFYGEVSHSKSCRLYGDHWKS